MPRNVHVCCENKCVTHGHIIGLFIRTFGSRNTTGSLLRMELNSKPYDRREQKVPPSYYQSQPILLLTLALFGPLGMTTTNPGVCAR